MSERSRNRHSPEFKAKVAAAAIRERSSAAGLSPRHRVHPTQAGQWKRQALAAFVPSARQGRTAAEREMALLARIGAQQVRMDRLEGRLPGVGHWSRPHRRPVSLRPAAAPAFCIPAAPPA